MDIFDLKDISDIPAELKVTSPKIKTPPRIMELLTIANRPLSINELTVGHFRKYGKVKNKAVIASTMAKMVKNDKYNIKKTSKGVYELVKKGDK